MFYPIAPQISIQVLSDCGVLTNRYKTFSLCVHCRCSIIFTVDCSCWARFIIFIWPELIWSFYRRLLTVVKLIVMNTWWTTFTQNQINKSSSPVYISGSLKHSVIRKRDFGYWTFWCFWNTEYMLELVGVGTTKLWHSWIFAFVFAVRRCCWLQYTQVVVWRITLRAILVSSNNWQVLWIKFLNVVAVISNH